MNRTIIKIGLLLVFMATIIIGITVYASQEEEEPIEAGKWIGASIKNILFNGKLESGDLNSQEAKRDIDNPDPLAGTILGENITVRQLDLRTKLFELSGSKDPLGEAWDSLKVQVYEKQFAEEHGLTPSEQEVIDFTKAMRGQVESTPGDKDFSKELIEAAGMTEEE